MQVKHIRRGGGVLLSLLAAIAMFFLMAVKITTVERVRDELEHHALEYFAGRAVYAITLAALATFIVSVIWWFCCRFLMNDRDVNFKTILVRESLFFGICAVLAFCFDAYLTYESIGKI